MVLNNKIFILFEFGINIRFFYKVKKNVDRIVEEKIIMNYREDFFGFLWYLGFILFL